MRSLVLKRIFDVFFSSLAILVLTPFILGAAFIIWLNDPSALPFFVQPRVGKNGKLFKMFKIRTMVSNAESLRAALADQNNHSDCITFKMVKDPRVLPFGSLLRKSSVDELPQLLNILLGDMSIVGPRPPIVPEFERYTESDKERLAVLPGLTCIWQVSGRSLIPFDKQVQMDKEYISKRSLGFDIKLIAQTIPAVLKSKGAF